MLIEFLTVITLAAPTRADSVQIYYANRDVNALQTLCANPLSREEDLLCRYRLYPLTGDDRLIDDLVHELDEASAREQALLAGLWGYRAAQGGLLEMVRCGRRSHKLLQKAKQLLPEDPIVLLIDGQSLLFRPGVFGGDAHRALMVFRRLQDAAANDMSGVVSPLEADLWLWYTLRKLQDPAADVMRELILEMEPPPLYLAFLENPPG